MAVSKLVLVEARASRTALPQMAASLLRLSQAASRYDVEAMLVHRKNEEGPVTTALAPGIRAVGVEEFLSRIFPPARAAR